MIIPIKKLRQGTLPSYQTPGAAGMDLCADLEADLVIQSGDRALVPAGFSMEIPQGYEAQIRPRSGLAFKHGLTVANAPGTIDSDYRGEVKVLLINLGKDPVTLKQGDRIAQMVIAPVIQTTLVEKNDLSETQRAAGGFGSTGVSK